MSARTDDIASITGRVGYAWDKVLVYGKGGAAYAHDKYSSNNAGAINNAVFGCGGAAPPDCAVAGSADRWGWTAGIGLEWAFATNWSAMIEYDHYGFDTKTISMVVTNATFPSFRPTSTSGTTSTRSRSASITASGRPARWLRAIEPLNLDRRIARVGFARLSFGAVRLARRCVFG